ncbi:hypothetical protein Gpo141_00009927 [Globisporangium polare]
MNALKLVAVALAVVCGVSSTTAAGSTSGSVGSASLLELVNEAKAAVASNPDLAALFDGLGDVSKLSEAELTKLVKEILAVTDSSGSGSGSGSASVTAGSSVTSKEITTSPSPSTTTSAPVVAPKSAASALALAPAAAITLAVSVVYTLL